MSKTEEVADAVDTNENSVRHINYKAFTAGPQQQITCLSPVAVVCVWSGVEASAFAQKTGIVNYY